MTLRSPAIKQRFFFLTIVLGMLLALPLVLAACGGDDEDDEPTAVPVTPVIPTPTVVSTPIPDISPVPPLDFDVEAQAEPTMQPLQIAFVQPATDDDIEQARVNLQAHLNQQFEGEVSILVNVYPNQRQAIDALCSGEPVMVWVDAFTYYLASGTCDVEPVLQVDRDFPPEPVGEEDETSDAADEDATATATEEETEVPVDDEDADDEEDELTATPTATLSPTPTFTPTATPTATPDTTFDLYYNRNNSGAASVANIVFNVTRLTVCRISATDEVSWVYPNITLRRQYLQDAVRRNLQADPLTGWQAIQQVDDYVEMLRAIEQNECNLGAIPAGTFDIWAAEVEEDEDTPLNINNTRPVQAGYDAPLIPDDLLLAASSEILDEDLVEQIVEEINALDTYFIEATPAPTEDTLGPAEDVQDEILGEGTGTPEIDGNGDEETEEARPADGDSAQTTPDDATDESATPTEEVADETPEADATTVEEETLSEDGTVEATEDLSAEPGEAVDGTGTPLAATGTPESPEVFDPAPFANPLPLLLGEYYQLLEFDIAAYEAFIAWLQGARWQMGN
jgi:hypothetical protein